MPQNDTARLMHHKLSSDIIIRTLKHRPTNKWELLFRSTISDAHN
jgi:hypothetical protein